MTDMKLYCGTGHRNITPPERLLPNLRGLGDNTFGGILDDIFVRVISFSNGKNRCLFIAFDLDKAPNPSENIHAISSKTGISEEHIFYFSIHTHTAPVTGYRPEEPINNVRLKPLEVQNASAEYDFLVETAMFSAIDEALATLHPVKMGYGYGKSYININRVQDYEYIDDNGILQTECCLGVNPEKPADHTLFVMRLEDEAGKPVAFFINYPVHNTVMHANQCCHGGMGISGDLGGEICRLLEERFCGTTAIWSSGAAGDINPVMMNEIYYPDPTNDRMIKYHIPNGDISILTILASRHLSDILKVLRNITCPIEYVPITGIIDWSFTPGQNLIRRDNGTIEGIAGDGVDPYEIRLHLLRLGDIVLYGLSGELYSSLGAKIKEASSLKDTIIISHDASLMARSGYIFDDETLNRDMAYKIPGHGNSHILPGYVAESLEKHTIAMFEKLILEKFEPGGKI